MKDIDRLTIVALVERAQEACQAIIDEYARPATVAALPDGHPSRRGECALNDTLDALLLPPSGGYR
jgi:hypothetical protein